MRIQGVIDVTSGGERRHCIEFPVAFKGVPSFAFGVTTTIADGPIACSAVVTGWRAAEGPERAALPHGRWRAEEIVMAAWVHVWIVGADDAVFTVNYVFEGEPASDPGTDHLARAPR